MQIKRILAIIVKEFREILRDPLYFSLAFIVPSMIMFMFGYGLSLDVENIPFAIVDHDKTHLSRDYTYKFAKSRYFNLKAYVEDERLLDGMLDEGKIRVGIVIPEHFQEDLSAGRDVAVQSLIDGTLPYRTKITKGYVIVMNAAFNSEILSHYIAKIKGIPLEQVIPRVNPITLQVRYLYNESVKSIYSLAPALIGMILLMLPPFLTALGIVREKEAGSIYNIYSSTVTRFEFLIGKLFPYVIISIINANILWIMVTSLFGVPFKGNLPFFVFASIIYVICSTGIGLLVSIFVRTQIAAMMVTTVLTVIPAWLYSGVVIPISSLDRIARIEAHLFPAMYYNYIVMGSFLKGVGINILWKNVVALIIYSIVLFTAGYLLFRKRVKA
jgi:ABC-2 type transport system permease protein/ribosome-dependent ATPase